jgi:hypothetical protein
LSLNAALNATIALIQNRTEYFKELLRDPGSDVRDISAVRVRLNKALEFHGATVIRGALMETLHLAPAPPKGLDSEASDLYTEAFYAGVRAVEAKFEDLVGKLEKK